MLQFLDYSIRSGFLRGAFPTTWRRNDRMTLIKELTRVPIVNKNWRDFNYGYFNITFEGQQLTCDFYASDIHSFRFTWTAPTRVIGIRRCQGREFIIVVLLEDASEYAMYYQRIVDPGSWKHRNTYAMTRYPGSLEPRLYYKRDQYHWGANEIERYYKQRRKQQWSL